MNLFYGSNILFHIFSLQVASCDGDFEARRRDVFLH